MNVLPLRGQCLVEILPANLVTEAGLFIPPAAKNADDMGKLPPLRARVWRLGAWPQKPNGFCQLPEFAPGDTVLVSQYAGQKLRYLGGRFRLVPVADVLAKLL